MGFKVLQSYLPRGKENEPVTHDKITRTFPDGSVRHFSVHLQPISWHGQAATLVVAWEITQVENAKVAVEEYAEKLKRSNQDLQEFAMIASHDLQEPLRKIETFADMLALRATGLDERSRDHVQRMRNAAQRMRAMIEGLLQLSRVSTQERPFSSVDLAALTEEVVSDLGNQVRRTHGTVEVGFMNSVEGDPIQLRELLQNLISNGLKYHKPDVEPLVKVSSRPLQDSIEIRVEDNGIGFEQEFADRVFEPFQRLVGRTEFEGSGMGLAICRRIIERHRGSIRAESAPGQGAVFILTLPISQPGNTTQGIAE
jgi:light-regulated signal transduction histidine kinase (bacteriophytochrome)